jgi:hypothetical protein
LTEAVYQAKDKSLGHCNAVDLVVYSAGTEFPKEEDELRPGKPVPTDSTDEKPLRVVAPENKQQGKNFMMLSFLLDYTCSMHT